MSRKTYYRFFRVALVGILLLTLLTLSSQGVHDAKAQVGPLTLSNDKLTFQSENHPAVGNDTVVTNTLESTALGAGKYDDNHVDWVYNGDWATYSGGGPYNSSLHYSTTIDSYALLVFNGPQFVLTYTGRSNRGQMTVFVDNVNAGTIDQYSSSIAWQQTWISPTFSDGPHTLKLVHATGATVDIDAIQIIGTASPGKYDDSHTSWFYSSNWASYTSSGPFNNTLHYSSAINDYAALAFKGTKFILTYTSFSNRGQVTVLVDDVEVDTLDENNTSLAWQQTWTSPTYTYGAHTIKLVHATGTIVDIDAIEIIGPLSPGVYDDNHNNWSYSGAWASYAGSGPYNSTLHYSTTATTDFATLEFVGTQFILTYTGNVNRGQMTVLVDDADQGTIDQYSSSLTWQKAWTSPVLPNGVHTLKLVHATGSIVDIDAIQILSPLPAGIYDDPHSSWVYNGNWASYSGSGPYNNTMHYSTTINDYAALAFEGIQFTLTYTGYVNRGQVTVFVDNVNRGTINQYNSSLAWQRTWTSPTFTAGVHTLRLVHASGTYVDIDAIEIIAPSDTTPPAAIDTLQAVSGTSLGSVNLSWSAVGDDGYIGIANSYQVRRSNDVMNHEINNEADWNAATPVNTGIPTPGASGHTETMTISTNLTPGDTYYFAVRAFDEAFNPGPVSTVTTNSGAEAFLPDAPENDNFEGAIEIDGNPYTNTQDYFYAATTETIDPEISACASDEGVYSIWYSYTPNNDGILTVDTYGTNLAYDTIVAIWTHNDSTFTHVACNRNASGSTFLSEASAFVTSGVTYYIEVVQYSQAVTSASAIKSLDVPSHIDEVVLNAKFTQTTPLGIDKYDDINGSWIYSDNWATFNAAGPYNNTLHYSTALNSSALVAFEGARFKLTYTGYGNRGQVSVIVDNVNVGTINQYNSSLAWQQTWISPTFTHSIHTLKLVHATGAFVDIDAIEVLPVPPLGPGKYDDTQTDWVYSGNWATYANSGPYKNTLHYSTDVDDHAVLVFRGIQFILTYTGNVNRGQATVLVDGNPEGTINQYNSSLAWQQTWTSPTFTNGVHTLQLTHEAGDIFDVDAIQIIGPLPPGKYDDTHISPYYNGNWATYTSSGPYNNTLHYSNIVNEDIALQFEGTQFILTYTGNVNRGQMTVLVDGNPEGTINQYNSSLAWQQTWTSPTFTNGVHTLQLTHASGAFVDIDAIQIIGPLPPGKYDDTNTSWNYTGNWATYTGSGSYNNTLHYSSTLNDDATVQIEGTQFILTYTGYVNRGQVTVLVDGNPAGTIDQYNPSLAWQKTWTSPTFTYDVHTLQLINAGGAVVDIDAIQVIVP